MKLSKQMPTYVSEITQFISELKQKNPKLDEQQVKGRALLWDKAPLDLDQSKRDLESSVNQTPYVYQNEH